MATQRSLIDPDVLDNPIWPDRLPESNAARMLYSDLADELVVHFVDERDRHPVYVFISTPDYGYAAVEVDGITGEVIGVMVYPVIAYAVKHHPAWQAATKPNPDPSVAESIVRDIKDLYDRYGIVTGDDEQT